jgi:hypothetical protein
VGKLDGASGSLLWLAHLDSTNGTYTSTPAVDASGNVIVSGYFYSNLTVGGTTLSNPAGPDGFVGKWDGASGALLWLAHLDSTNYTYANTPVVDASGNVIVSGSFYSNLTVGGTTLSNPAGSDGFVGKWDGASGALLWLAHLDGTNGTHPRTPVVDASGNVIVSGYFYSNLTVGGTTLSNPAGTDEFVGKWDGASGALLWLSHLDSTNYTYANTPVMDASGNVIVSGYFYGNLTLGGTTLSNDMNSPDGFVAQIQASAGALSWVRHFDSTPGLSSVPVLAVTPASILVLGNFQGSLNTGGPAPLMSAGCSDIFLSSITRSP